MKLQRLEHPPRSGWGARAAARTGRGTTATGHGAALILSVYYTYRAKADGHAWGTCNRDMHMQCVMLAS